MLLSVQVIVARSLALLVLLFRGFLERIPPGRIHPTLVGCRPIPVFHVELELLVPILVLTLHVLRDHCFDCSIRALDRIALKRVCWRTYV